MLLDDPGGGGVEEVINLVLLLKSGLTKYMNLEATTLVFCFAA